MHIKHIFFTCQSSSWPDLMSPYSKLWFKQSMKGSLAKLSCAPGSLPWLWPRWLAQYDGKFVYITSQYLAHLKNHFSKNIVWFWWKKSLYPQGWDIQCCVGNSAVLEIVLFGRKVLHRGPSRTLDDFWILQVSGHNVTKRRGPREHTFIHRHLTCYLTGMICWSLWRDRFKSPGT